MVDFQWVGDCQQPHTHHELNKSGDGLTVGVVELCLCKNIPRPGPFFHGRTGTRFLAKKCVPFGSEHAMETRPGSSFLC